MLTLIKKRPTLTSVENLKNQNKDMSRDSEIIKIFFIVNCGYFWEGETWVTKKKKEVRDISEEFLVFTCIYFSYSCITNFFLKACMFKYMNIWSPSFQWRYFRIIVPREHSVKKFKSKLKIQLNFVYLEQCTYNFIPI